MALVCRCIVVSPAFEALLQLCCACTFAIFTVVGVPVLVHPRKSQGYTFRTAMRAQPRANTLATGVVINSGVHNSTPSLAHVLQVLFALCVWVRCCISSPIIGFVVAAILTPRIGTFAKPVGFVISTFVIICKISAVVEALFEQIAVTAFAPLLLSTLLWLPCSSTICCIITASSSNAIVACRAGTLAGLNRRSAPGAFKIIRGSDGKSTLWQLEEQRTNKCRHDNFHHFFLFFPSHSSFPFPKKNEKRILCFFQPTQQPGAL